MPADSLQQQLQRSLGTAYTLERELGGGGMSRVFVALETALGRRVVVKVLPREAAEGMSVERFAREIRLAAALQEPHIVPVLAAGTTADELPWYTMPYVEGESLRARLAAGALPAGAALGILRNVAQALAYAHARGIVHRDIKPENVLLSSGTAVVTDFGIAKALQASRTRAPDGPAGATGAITQHGTSLGTPAYMAPEQAAGDPGVDHRADLYAWGVMAYELLAGRHPFAACTTAQQLLAAHIAEEPAPLARSGAQVSRPVAQLVMRCLAKEPARRPASATELLAVLDGTHSGSAPATTGEGGRRTLVAAAALLLAVCVAGAAYAWRDRAGSAVDGASGAGRAPAARTDTGAIRLAVLPFEHQGPPDQAVFADGLTDAVTAKLGALPTLAVIDRRSAAQYRGTTKGAREIARELDVRYLLEGVVRWARDGSGAWRAQVTPTLVDAASGTARWTGTPEVITPTDPFTAQGEIAAGVARALEVALRPADEAGLRRRPTDDPDAFAAWVRARALAERMTTAGEVQRMTDELRRAVAIDSGFADAWGMLAFVETGRAMDASGDRAAEARMRAAVAQAGRRAPDHPLTLLALARQRVVFDRDTTGADALVERAVAGAGNDAAVLALASDHLVDAERAYQLLQRAAALDPRSPTVLESAAATATLLRRWPDARRFAGSLLALDSLDERPWQALLRVEWYRGDTLAMQRLLARALAAIPRPSRMILGFLPYAGAEHARRFVALSARELGVETLPDSISIYYDSKADALDLLGDHARARACRDSIRRLVPDARELGPALSHALRYRAYTEASMGDTAAARRTLDRLRQRVRPQAARPDLSDLLDARLMASTHAQLGRPDSAVHWLEIGLRDRNGWTARGYAAYPKLRVLRGTAELERFLRAHPQE